MSNVDKLRKPLAVSVISSSYGFFGALAFMWGAWTFARASLYYLGDVILDIGLTTPLPAPLSCCGMEIFSIAGVFFGAGLAAVLGAIGLYGLKGWGWWLIQQATLMGVLLYGYATLAQPVVVWGFVPMVAFTAVGIYLYRVRSLFGPRGLSGVTVAAVVGFLLAPVVGWITMVLRLQWIPVYLSRATVWAPSWAFFYLSLLFGAFFALAPFAYWRIRAGRTELLE